MEQENEDQLVQEAGAAADVNKDGGLLNSIGDGVRTVAAARNFVAAGALELGNKVADFFNGEAKASEPSGRANAWEGTVADPTKRKTPEAEPGRRGSAPPNRPG